MDYFYLDHKDHIYMLSSKSRSEPCNFALFWGDLKWNDPIETMFQYVRTKILLYYKSHCLRLQ